MAMAHHLPENEVEWPRDPWRVLGVARDDDERTIRRAYATLIRTFKPDVFPSQFQRIRQSYETVLAHAQLRKDSRLFDDDREPMAVDDGSVIAANLESAAPVKASPEGPVIDPSVPPGGSRTLSEIDPIAEAWRIATSSHLEEAIEYLRRSELQGSQSSETRLANYWFRRLTARTAAAEREELIFATPGKDLHDHRLLVAYLTALRDHPEARTDRCRNSLLSAPVNVAWRIARLRWKALARAGEWWEIDQDLVFLLENEAVPAAARIQWMLEVADLRVWETSNYHETFWQQSTPVVDEWLNEERAASWLADRWDVLLQLRSDCSRLDQSTEFGEAARPFQRLLRTMATGSPRQIRTQLTHELQQWRLSPGRVWQNLTMVREETPTLFFELAGKIKSLTGPYSEHALSPSRLAALFNDQVPLDRLLIGAPADRLSPAVAMAIYEFCTRTASTLDSITHALLATDNDGQNSSSLLLLRTARPLDLLIEGSLLFWEL
jgi:hypothetical protein